MQNHSAAKAAPRRPGKRGGDPIARWLTYAAFAAIVLILTILLYVVYTGILRPQPPRTAAERQIQTLSKAVEAKPLSPEIWRDYIRALVVAKQYAKVERVATQGRKTLGNDAGVIDVEVARMWWIRGNGAKALNFLEKGRATSMKAVKTEMESLLEKGISVSDSDLPQFAPALESYILEGQIRVAQKQWQKAVDAYSKAIDAKSDMADVMTARGFAYLELNEDEKAKADFERALKFDPELSSAKTGLKEVGK